MPEPLVAETKARTSGRTIRILVAEDDVADCALMMAAIRRHGYAVEHVLVDSPDVFRQALADHDFDVVLSDHNLQNWTASDALEIVRLTGRDIPVIIVTGFLGDERAVAYLKEGAADYVVKEHLDRLPFAVTRALQERAQRAEKVTLQKKMQEAKEDWERTFDAIPHPIMLLNRESRIVRANRATAELFEVDLAQVINLPYFAVTHKTATQPRDYPVRRMFASGKKEEADIEDRRLGKIFHVTAIPLDDHAGRITGSILEMVDVTERKRAESANAILLKEVNQRVKNSFGVIESLLNLQAARTTDSAIREALRTCDRRIECVALVHEHIYRSESTEHIDFDVFAMHLARHLYSVLGVSESDIRLDLQLSSQEVSVLHAGAVGLALNELLVNALTHAFPPRRKGTVRVSLEEVEGGKRRLRVSDDGIGMTNAGTGAEGLGWKIVRCLAQRLNGEVVLENGTGTAVQLIFPAVPEGKAQVAQLH